MPLTPVAAWSSNKLFDAWYAESSYCRRPTGLDGNLAAALDREATGQLQRLGSADFREGVTAFLQKREPRFQGS